MGQGSQALRRLLQMFDVGCFERLHVTIIS
jgi:hypothetical protein